MVTMGGGIPAHYVILGQPPRAIRYEACLAMSADRPTEPINPTLKEQQI